jgi:hypothetical protein
MLPPPVRAININTVVMILTRRRIILFERDLHGFLSGVSELCGVTELRSTYKNETRPWPGHQLSYNDPIPRPYAGGVHEPGCGGAAVCWYGFRGWREASLCCEASVRLKTKPGHGPVTSSHTMIQSPGHMREVCMNPDVVVQQFAGMVLYGCLGASLRF